MPANFYPVLPTKESKDYLEAVRSGGNIDPNSFISRRKCRLVYDESGIQLLFDKLRSIQSQFPEELPVRGPKGGEFEAISSREVHQYFRSFPEEAIDDADFWRYISVCHFGWLVEWRHGGKDRFANLANYGIGADRRNLLLRMFYRAAVSFDESNPSDPYHLSVLGDEDLWKSHFGAVKIGNCPEIVKAFVKVVFATASSATLSTPQVRELAKNLTRLRSNVILDVYDSDMAVKLIQLEAEKIREQFR
jgi:hypothetical protein